MSLPSQRIVRVWHQPWGFGCCFWAPLHVTFAQHPPNPTHTTEPTRGSTPPPCSAHTSLISSFLLPQRALAQALPSQGAASFCLAQGQRPWCLGPQMPLKGSDGRALISASCREGQFISPFHTV